MLGRIIDGGGCYVYKGNTRTFEECFDCNNHILMEGALGERLKREYLFKFNNDVVMGDLIYSERGRNALCSLWSEYAEIAYNHSLPFIATTPTRRLNKHRVEMAGYSKDIIMDNVKFLNYVRLKQRCEMYIGGMIGSSGDAYTGKGCLLAEEAEAFHSWEIEQFALAGVDFIYAALIPTIAESLGIARAMSRFKAPYIISFTINENGCLIDGTTISDAIEMIDNVVELKPICYMTNCVHPNIVYTALTHHINMTAQVKRRFLGIQVNTSELSYDKLEGSKELITSDPKHLASSIMRLLSVHKMKIIGGCCGTDGSHMKAIAERLTSQSVTDY